MEKRVTLTVIALLAMVNFAFTQYVDLKPGYHHLDPGAKKFAGIWEWKKGNDSFMLILSFQEVEFKRYLKGVTADVILGWHKFVKNGKVVEDSTPFKYSNFCKGKWTILSGSGMLDKNLLEGTIQHKSKKKSVNFKIKYIDTDHIKLVTVFNIPGTKVSTDEHPYDSSISLPQNIVLTRVK